MQLLCQLAVSKVPLAPAIGPQADLTVAENGGLHARKSCKNTAIWLIRQLFVSCHVTCK